MKNLTKALVGTLAAGALAVSTATPALAAERDGIGAGEVIAGALVLGGIAAVAAAASNDNHAYGRDYRYGRGYGYGYGRGHSGMDPRQAVQRCVAAAERDGSRYAYGRTNVTQITEIDHERGGFDIKGRIVVEPQHRWRGGWRDRDYDSGRFSCKIRYGRIADLDFSGIRGL